MPYSCGEWYDILWLHITNTKLVDGSWDEMEPTWELEVIHVCGWDLHAGDIGHKSYTLIDLQPVIRLASHLTRLQPYDYYEIVWFVSIIRV